MNATKDVDSSRYDTLDFHDEVLSLASGILNIVLGVPLNLYVIMLITTRGTLVSDFFSLNLALSEIVYAMFLLFYMLFIILKSFAFLQVFMFSAGFMYVARPFFQCFICVDCFVRVIHPVVFLRYKHLRYKAFCCGAVWLITFCSCIYSLKTFTKPLCLYAFYILNLLFFFVMLSCCLIILRALKLPRPGEMAAKGSKSNAIKRRAFKTILIIMVSMAVHFLLYLATIPLQCCLKTMTFQKVFTICMCIVLQTGFIQPLLYLHRNGKIPCFFVSE